jgi:hypothetical protein
MAPYSATAAADGGYKTHMQILWPTTSLLHGAHYTSKQSEEHKPAPHLPAVQPRSQTGGRHSTAHTAGCRHNSKGRQTEGVRRAATHQVRQLTQL